MRLRAAFGATALALGATGLAALPARGALCVNVVVDDSAHTPTRHCTATSYGATAAEVLARRSAETGTTPPRYHGNFLCAIDGYPETGCGDDQGATAYWAFWAWVRGAWVYQQVGVDSYTVEDADHDGHPDPIGFRYSGVNDHNSPPRATGGVTASPAPRGTTPPPAPRSTTTRPAPRTASAGVPSSVSMTAPPADGSATPGAFTTIRTSGAASPGAATPSGDPATTLDAVEPTATGARGRGGVPVGTVAGVLLAAALFGATAWRLRSGRP
jgi:hypothetical protein